MTRVRTVAIALAVAALGACSEKPQTADNSAKKSDTRAYEGVQDSHLVSGWKAGDSGSWEEQMRVRVQHQNEYIRVK